MDDRRQPRDWAKGRYENKKMVSLKTPSAPSLVSGREEPRAGILSESEDHLKTKSRGRDQRTEKEIEKEK
jgi:hypothetical protein